MRSVAYEREWSPLLDFSGEYGTTLPYPASLGAYLRQNDIKEGCLTDFGYFR